MQELVGLDLRAGRGATMSCAMFEETVGPEPRPYLPSLSGTSPSFDHTFSGSPRLPVKNYSRKRTSRTTFFPNRSWSFARMSRFHVRSSS